MPVFIYIYMCENLLDGGLLPFAIGRNGSANDLFISGCHTRSFLYLLFDSCTTIVGQLQACARECVCVYVRACILHVQ